MAKTLPICFYDKVFSDLFSVSATSFCRAEQTEGGVFNDLPLLICLLIALLNGKVPGLTLLPGMGVPGTWKLVLPAAIVCHKTGSSGPGAMSTGTT